MVFTVPVTHANQVRKAIGEAGGGKQGNYSFCSFSVLGIGRFKPEPGAHPAIGEVGKLQEIEEERVEILCDQAVLTDAVAALKATHPYEEPAYDIYCLEDF